MQTFENSASPVPYLFADNIGWGSPVMLVAPEPATLSVGAIALGALTLRRRR
jgi:MYXO-CTERM domain-containing protein